VADNDAPNVADLVVGLFGGTGEQGRGLARRLALAGQPVFIGSRSANRALAAAEALRADTGSSTVSGAPNLDVARYADLVIVAVPYEGHRDLLAECADPLAGKVVVDCVNPLGFDEQGAFPLRVPAGSAAEEAAQVLPRSRVVAAFHHMSAVQLLDPDRDRVDTDVLVLGDDRAATDLVQALAERIPGVRGVYAGRLRNAGQVEALTANLISVNRRYRGHAGIRLSDLPGYS
jgi:NADPH-dependent F420 reductase